MDPLQTNRALWDGWTRLHTEAAFYDVFAFRAGASTLKPIEVREVGAVEGLDLLHLQCHFGLDTLSWARLGARATGVDFSQEAVQTARALADELNLDASFVQSDVLDLPDTLHGRFDRVITSYGVLPWLADLDRWGAQVAACLRPGGRFHLVEFHPLLDTLSDDGTAFHHGYFKVPVHYTAQGSYAAPDADFEHEGVCWTFSLSEVVTALLNAGLHLEAFREYDYSPYDCYPFLQERAPGEFVAPPMEVALPHLFSLTASLPEATTPQPVT